MHEACGVEFPHGCIYNWKSCSALFPSVEMILIVLPLDFVELGLERVIFAIEYSGEVMAYIDVEITPMQLIY